MWTLPPLLHSGAGVSRWDLDQPSRLSVSNTVPRDALAAEATRLSVPGPPLLSQGQESHATCSEGKCGVTEALTHTDLWD